MHRERDYRGRFVGRGKSLIPTSSLTPPRPRSATPPTQTLIPSFSGKHKFLGALRSKIQRRDSPASSTKAIIEEEDPTSSIEGVIFLSSTREKLLGQELEIPNEEEEEENYFNLPLIEELKEELENPILEPYISSKESTMVGEEEGEVHNINGQ